MILSSSYECEAMEMHEMHVKFDGVTYGSNKARYLLAKELYNT